jgi:flagellar biosynthesis/type III secretory pathway protein FliH
MSRRFHPPPLAAFYASPEVDEAQTLAETRDQGFAEGHSAGLKQGYEAGFMEGAAETRAALQPELDALRESSGNRERRIGVAEALRRVLAARDADLATVERASRELAAAALQALFPTLLASAAGSEIAALLADALAERAPETLILRAHPETLATIAAETASERVSGRLMPEPMPDMPFGVAEAAWNGGGITFDLAALLARVTSVLAVASLPAPDPIPEAPIAKTQELNSAS